MQGRRGAAVAQVSGVADDKERESSYATQHVPYAFVLQMAGLSLWPVRKGWGSYADRALPLVFALPDTARHAQYVVAVKL